MRLIQFGSILLFAIALLPGGAHLLELASKMQLDRASYMTVQQVYQGWNLMGIEQMVALMAGLVLSVLSRQQRAPFWLALAGSALLAASLAVFFVWIFPVNMATSNWTAMPADWMAMRQQWEYSHAAGTLLVFSALCCVTGSGLSWKKTAIDDDMEERSSLV